MSKQSSKSSSKKSENVIALDVTEVNQLKIEERPQWINSLLNFDSRFESPVDVNLTYTFPVDLPQLIWHHNDLPSKKMKLTNTGHTLILSAKWHQERPYLSGGPLLGNYVFSQLHFHWGENNMEGSEHTIDGAQQPLEMHVVHFKSTYLTQEAALKERDGIVVLAFFFKIQSNPNPAIQLITDAIPFIQKPHTSARIDPLPLCFLLRAFFEDYYLYWGSVTTSSCMHLILWLLSREPIGISSEQLDVFRSLLDTNEEPLLRNFRTVQQVEERRIFHISPGCSLYATLLQVPRYEFTFKLPQSKNPQPVYSETLDPEQQVFRAELHSNNPFKNGIPKMRPRSSFEHGRNRENVVTNDRPRSAGMQTSNDLRQYIRQCENARRQELYQEDDGTPTHERARTAYHHYRY